MWDRSSRSPRRLRGVLRMDGGACRPPGISLASTCKSPCKDIAPRHRRPGLPTREPVGQPPGIGCVLAVACGRQQGGDECVTMLHALPGMSEIWQSCGLLFVS